MKIFKKCCALFLAVFTVISLALPASANQSGSTEDYNEAQLAALLNFYRFELLLEDGKTKVQNHEYADIDIDLTKPWEYPGITWSDTKPYAVISIDLSDSPKISGKLDVSSMNKLQSVDISGTEIDWLVLGKNTELTDLKATNSSVLSLDLSECTGLQNVNCQNSSIQKLVLPQHTLHSVQCQNNYLTFSTLPALNCAKEYDYVPQKDTFFIAHSQVNTLEIDTKVKMDYYGADTVEWFYEDGTPINATLVKDQTYTLEGLALDDTLYAVMTSEKFPELSITTNKITVIQNTKKVLVMFIASILIFFVIFFAIRYIIAKRQGIELTTDKFTDKIAEKFSGFIKKIRSKFHKKK